MARARLALVALGLAVLGIVAATPVGLAGLAANAEATRNTVHGGAPAPSDRARALHERLWIADLHADPLLWDRDLLERGAIGHTDVPRLREGNVALQVFGVVTKTPQGMNVDHNDDTTDAIRLLAIAQGWPPSTWTSLRARALHQAEKLRRLAERSDGRVALVRARGDLDALLAARGDRLGALLALEGMHALEGDLAAIDAFYEAGFRMMGPAHFFDTDVAGSAHGVDKGGLTALGRAAIGRMEALGITVDLAHASARTITDVLALATRPVVVSHTGVRGTCDNNRNLTDDQLRAIARSGGVVGIGYWETATCGRDAAAIARAIRHAVDVAGVAHVGLGSDFDGAVAAPFDATGLAAVTDALLDAGFDEEAIRAILGGNVARVLRANLPE